MSTTGRSGTSSFKGLDNKHKAIAKAVQVLTGNAIIADANRRLSAKPLFGLRGTEGSNPAPASGESRANSVRLRAPAKGAAARDGSNWTGEYRKALSF